ncbi:MAG: DUF1611 domain-containing protein [Candidatus Aminicenantes bacterium]|nr:DUF1611 domain-containing protein [Candidatus Aminicenantes bacterium]NIM79408.1 DUF1611 domain-containing protein [Candidatus Aminicenantes bacterium]NIN18690.1 DUF1611 domain-containing protein [Candidatus Aminicenantes bacterium]NIN42587.1 DUF1611 domain-containing protein [Candidatus Aminicenantes bacterium]NIN85353.1 DUF1611 domain-containing protein [Candidatus Aminicenantes bacterium]
MNPNSSNFPEGNAVLYCEGAFNTTYGKTAHGLVRFTRRYRVLSVVDSCYAGQDAGDVLDGKNKNIPVFASVEAAEEASRAAGTPVTHFVVGLAPDGGRLSPDARQHVKNALQLGLHIDSGLHDFLSEDPDIAEIAKQKNVRIRDIRKPPPRSQLHFFSGRIEQVESLKIAVLGTDSAIGKRTTAWLLVHALNNAGYRCEMIGTGQTSWMQGADYCLILDSLVNDFVSGEIEYAVWSAWNHSRPDVIVIEGQGSLMNPAYPGGFEILAAGRPDLVFLQHAPMRKEYDGFPGYPLHPLAQQIHAVEMLSGKPVAAVTINHENLPPEKIPLVCDAITQVTGLPAVDVLYSGAGELVNLLIPYLENHKKREP